MSMRPSICFIAHPAWGEMSGGKNGEIGGIQRQLSMMSRWFAARGYTVSMLVDDEGQPDEVMIDGVRVIKMCRRDEGWPVVRFVRPRWSSLVAAMRRANADIYYQNTAEYVTGQAAYWCQRNGRSFIFSVANDWDCELQGIRRMPLHERTLYLWGLKRATYVISQTRTQQCILREAHGVESVVIPMPSPPTGNGSPVVPPDPSKPRVVWVARIAQAKRLEMLLDVAERTPEISFEVAGTANPASEYADRLLRRAGSLPNVKMLGRVERERIPQLYRGSTCLCCTSFHEGFPNTFLEAWSQGVPVVSTFDPDGLIASLGLGGVAQDADGIAYELRRLVANREQWREASRRGEEYYVRNHLPANVIRRFEEVFWQAAHPNGRSPMGVIDPRSPVHLSNGPV
jgi:glycosyltransferase involved in cell wall biosynthesis